MCFLVGCVDAPHLDHALDLWEGQVEGWAAHHVPDKKMINQNNPDKELFHQMSLIMTFLSTGPLNTTITGRNLQNQWHGHGNKYWGRLSFGRYWAKMISLFKNVPCMSRSGNNHLPTIKRSLIRDFKGKTSRADVKKLLRSGEDIIQIITVLRIRDQVLFDPWIRESGERTKSWSGFRDPPEPRINIPSRTYFRELSYKISFLPLDPGSGIEKSGSEIRDPPGPRTNNPSRSYFRELSYKFSFFYP